jgi:LmbE family N-acetylglucosaminyl deacetylase
LKARLKECTYYFFHTGKLNTGKKLADCNKLILTAHPDDEILFFGGQLISESGWLVICFTNGGSRKRSEEFSIVMERVGAEHMILNFRDGENITWSRRKIDKAVSAILSRRKEWVRVLTHNNEGEYGHYQHKQLHESVMRVYKGSSLYFSCARVDLAKESNRLPVELQLQKKDIFKNLYKSQSFILDCLPEYFEYERQEISGKVMV